MQRRYISGIATQVQREFFDHAISVARRYGAVIGTHEPLDADGLGASYSLKRIIGGRRVTIVTSNMMAHTDPLVAELQLNDLKRWSQIAKNDKRPRIVVDTNTATVMPSAKGKLKEEDVLMVLDHHSVTSIPLTAPVFIRNETATAVCEMLALLVPSRSIEEDPSIALALATGIAADNARMTATSKQTQQTFRELVKVSGKSESEIYALAYPPLSPRTFVNLLNDTRHLRTEIYRGKVISVGKTTQELPSLLSIMLNAITPPNNPDSSYINVAVALGAIDNGVYKVSFRVKQSDVDHGIIPSEIAKRTSADLGMPREDYMGGHGNMAAGVVRGAYEDIVDTIIRRTKEAIDHALGRKR